MHDHVSREATVATDERTSYVDITGLSEQKHFNHSAMNQVAHGMNTNHVESFFSRIQRAYVGIHHRFLLKYFDWYVDLAGREDHRRKSNGQITALVLLAVMGNPTSRELLRLLSGEQAARSDLRGLRPAVRAHLSLRGRFPTGGGGRPASPHAGRAHSSARYPGL